MSVNLLNFLTGETVWQLNREYGSFLLLELEVDEELNIHVLSLKSPDVAEEVFLPDYDPAWPGPMPDDPLFSFNINFKFDLYDHYLQSFYQLYRLTAEDVSLAEWQTVKSIDMSSWSLVDKMIALEHESATYRHKAAS